MRRKADKPEQKAPEAQEAAAEAAPLVVPRGQTPILKVKPLGSRAGGDGTGAAVRRGTLFQNDAEGQDETAAGLAEEADKRALLKTIVSSPAPQPSVRSPYATYRPAPPDEAAEKEELAAVTGRKAEREVSAGFLLGVALIIVALLGGIAIVRLHKKVDSLERRLASIEGAHVLTAEADLLSP